MSVATNKNYYEILGVEKNATQDDIKKAYRKKAKEYHPDVNKSPEADAIFKEIGEAYSVLSDDQKRSMYDMGGTGNMSGGFPFGFSNPFDIFDSVFGNARQQGFQNAPRDNGRFVYNINIAVNITLDESYTGVIKNVNYVRELICKDCNGTGAEGNSKETCIDCGGSGRKVTVTRHGPMVMQQEVMCGSCGGRGQIITVKCKPCDGRGVIYKDETVDVNVPKGISNGMKLRLPNAGNQVNDNSFGDVHCMVQILPHAIWERHGAHLVRRMDINLKYALAGGPLEVDLMDGKTSVDLEVPVQPGTTVMLRGKGMPILNTNGEFGDAQIIFNVVMPKLSEEQISKINDIL